MLYRSNIAKYVFNFSKDLVEYFSSEEFPKITQMFRVHTGIAPSYIHFACVCAELLHCSVRNINNVLIVCKHFLV